MGSSYNPKIVTDGLVLCLDAANPKSYPGSGTVWNDLSGNGNHGTLINGPTYNANNKGSITFDGVNDYVTTSYSSNNFSSQTISCWINKSNTQYSYVLSSSTQYYGLEIYPKIIYVNITASNFGYVSYDINGWQNILFVYNGILTGNSNRLQIYINGNIYTAGYTGTIPSTASHTTIDIGRRFWSVAYSQGKVANLQIYNRALSPSEIQQNFNATRGRYGI